MEKPTNIDQKIPNPPELPQRLELRVSVHGLPAIEVKNPSLDVAAIIRRVVMSNFIDDPDYQARTKVGAFLQGDDKDWILVEFWRGNEADQRAFVDYLNRRISE